MWGQFFFDLIAALGYAYGKKIIDNVFKNQIKSYNNDYSLRNIIW